MGADLYAVHSEQQSPNLTMPTTSVSFAGFEPAYSAVPEKGGEREACLGMDPNGFTIRHPPAPHQLSDFCTSEDQLFLTIHMGAAVVDVDKWILVIDGLVQHPFALTFDQLRNLPTSSITSFHECYGNPTKPPTEALWRIGNVIWTGIRLSHLLGLAQPLENAQFVCSDGLDHGTFAGVTSDRYQKDLPLSKALGPEVLVAFAMNGQPLGKERGGPVRLVVPGFFGTNSTKWLCRLTLQDKRASGPYTTTFYNEIDSEDTLKQKTRPVWAVEVNSMIVSPAPGTVVHQPKVAVEGWAWCHEPVMKVYVKRASEQQWIEATVTERDGFSWQKWRALLVLPNGEHTLVARAVSCSGQEQPLAGRRNHTHHVKIVVASNN
ncbi:Oxidoreductase, molybdopterin-binding domain-containing protein [Ilyonectria destructans]|nr:Oxidoreductase, molybdopterin-binding domain-containing protein [Ilyonectria destructans]